MSADRSHFQRFDPTWNYVPLTALVYALPLTLLSAVAWYGWLGPARALILPLGALSFAFARHMGLERGLAWVTTDFMHRPRVVPTLVLAYALFWVCALRAAPSVPVAVALFVILAVVYDALLERADVLVMLEPGRLRRVATWGLVGALLGLAHTLSSDRPLALLAAVAALCACVEALFLLAPARAQRLTGVRRVAVIGAGWSGLYATKWLAQLGLEVTCYERSAALGGLWRFAADRPGGVFRQTVVTSSKHFLHASDLPFDEGGDFPHHRDVLAFLERYVERFGLRPLLRLGCEVRRVTRHARGWTVESDAGREEYDAVVVAAGSHQQPRAALGPFARYAGRLMHTATYKDAAHVAPGETVVIVGGGESASDVAAECAARGARVHWSIAHGQWFADRHLGAYPADHLVAFGLRVFGGRFISLEYVMRTIVAALISRKWGLGGHGVPQWAPEVPNLHQFLNKSRDALQAVRSGALRPAPGVSDVQGCDVVFADGSRVTAQHVILATGFEPHWPFLPEQPERTFRKVFWTHDETLAYVGFARPVLGSIPSLSELQARWVAHVFAGRRPLPARARLALWAAREELLQRRWFLDRSRLGVLVDQEVYASDLAARVGAQVRWGRLLAFRPRLFWLLLLSPWSAFKYQLHDPSRAVRRAAEQRLRAVAPDARHPVQRFKYWVGLVLAAPLLAVAVAFVALPAALAPAALGLALLAVTAALRATELRPVEGAR